MITQSLPRYSANQVVLFMGGRGKILTCRPDSYTWTYAIEMEMEESPQMSRLGAETTILLYETEIEGVMLS